MTQNNISKLIQLKAEGQNPWYDNIERCLLESGQFARMVQEWGITGVTSNPTIFEKAITRGCDYDPDIRACVAQGKGAEDIYNELTMRDISQAADILQSVYDAQGGSDGFVSVEVLPRFAYAAERTAENALWLFQKLNRPNILIKVPATDEGIAAIRGLIRDGINVNVTLIFSRTQYRQVARAYIDAMKERLSQGMPLETVHSVASVFVSRLDTWVDGLLDRRIAQTKREEEKQNLASLKGTAAVANAKMIYQDYKELFFSEEFNVLSENGANRQTLLWASTSTKNPCYSSLKYVEELIAPHTINTMPPATLEEFMHRGKVEISIERELDKACEFLECIRDSGIDIEQVCAEIQRQGVRAFSDSFDTLITAIKVKMGLTAI